jgi:hypothetical protein
MGVDIETQLREILDNVYGDRVIQQQKQFTGYSYSNRRSAGS